MDTIKQRLMTEDEMMSLSAHQWFEIIRGEIVPMSPNGVEHHDIAGNVYDILRMYARKNRLGYVYMDGLIFVLSEDEEGIRESRIPDIGFVRKGRYPKDFDRARPFPGAPDLAIEIVSPSEGADEVMDKVSDYLAAGTEEVWVVYPRQKSLHRYTRQTPDNIRVYHQNDTLEPDTLFPELQIKIADFFAIEIYE